MSNKRWTKEKFIKEARKIHGDIYDYSKVNLDSGIKSKLEIIDPMYGVFFQNGQNHLKGHGNPDRAFEEIKIRNRKEQEESFIEKSKIIHGDFYDYSLVEYVNIDTTVKIIDPELGIFYQTPYCHLKGRNPLRQHIQTKSKLKKTEEFVKKSLELYGDIHDFSDWNFELNYKKTTLIDREYGEYLVTPRGHIEKGLLHPDRMGIKTHTHELDHIIPLSIICSAKERSTSFQRNRPLYKLLHSNVNLRLISKEENKRKNEILEKDGERISCRKIRNQYSRIKELILLFLNIDENEIDDIIDADKKYRGEL